MIIFDLDATLADCEHRRYFVDPKKDRNAIYIPKIEDGIQNPGDWFIKDKSESGILKKWKPNWNAFYEECDKDTPIEPVILTMRRLSQHEEIQIWSGRCESVRDKTVNWLYHKIPCFCPMSWFDKNLKMRPIGDSTPDDQLKEKWLNEYYHTPADNCLLRWATHDKCCKKIEMVFDDRKKVIDMWRRHGIFVFDVSQGKGDF